MKRRFWKFALLFAVPLALYASIAERNSWRPKTLAVVKGRPYGIAFSPDGNTLATAEVGGAVTLWDVHSRRLLRTVEAVRANCVSVSYAPDGKRLAYGGKDVVVWDTEHFKLDYTLQPEQGIVWSTLFSPDGRYLAATHNVFELPQPHFFLTVWDTRTRKRLWTATVSVPPTSLVFAQDGSWIGCGDGNDGVRFFAGNSGRLLRSFKLEPINVPAISPDGTIIAASIVGFTGTIKLWDARTGVFQKILQAPLSARVVVFSPDSRFLAGACRQSIVIWDIRTGRVVRQLNGHTQDVISLAFSPDGSTLASGSHDHTVKLWRIK